MDQRQNPKDLPDLQASINEFLEHRQEMGCTPNNVRGYEWALEHFAEHCPNLPVSHEDVAAAVERPEWSSKSRMRVLACIRAFLNWAEHRYGVASPFRQAI